MKTYCLKIKPLTSFGTPWHSDTIFGHLVWQVALHEGRDITSDFLEPFINQTPPFVLSDAFPGDLLPRPLPKVSSKKVTTVSEYTEQKAISKSVFVKRDDFPKVLNGEEIVSSDIESPYQDIETLHATIDRNSGTTSEGGGLYPTEESSLNPAYDHLSIYVRAEDSWIERVEELFNKLAMTGFGRDKSTGKGQFEYLGLEECFFPKIDNPDGFVTLSTSVPSENDPTEGRWRIKVKYGRLGEGVFANPFKRPLIQFEPGAVFKCADNDKYFFGRVVRDIAPGFPEAIENCQALIVPCRYLGGKVWA